MWTFNISDPAHKYRVPFCFLASGFSSLLFSFSPFCRTFPPSLSFVRRHATMLAGVKKAERQADSSLDPCANCSCVSAAGRGETAAEARQD